MNVSDMAAPGIRLYYNGSKQEVEIPASCAVEIVKPKIIHPSMGEDDIIQAALEHPTDSISLSNFIEENNSFLLVLNDHARATPTSKILKHVLPLLAGKKFGVIIASGTHELPSEEDLRNLILGEFYDELRKRLVFHDSKNDEFLNLGETQRGTPILVNKIVSEYEAFIPINSIEPHYFAGFTGGRKSLLPGICAFETIEKNHGMALLDESRLMALHGNPLHEDFEEATRVIIESHPTFAINVVFDGAHNIAGVFAGNIFTQLYKGAELAKEIYSPLVNQSPDVVISVVHSPLDQNLYQAQKGFESCLLTLKPGGILILVASCYDGIGPEDYAQMLQSGESPKDLADKFEEIKVNYKLGWHKVGSIPPFLADRELWMVTLLDKSNLDRMFIKGFDSLQDAVDYAVAEKGENCRFLIVEDSANVCPILR
ncbi:MAG: nickel-dependent lactate racemase [Candidatus Thorarchaeota archaeon]